MLQNTKINGRTGTIRGWLSNTSKGWWQSIRLNIFLIVFVEYSIQAFVIYETYFWRQNYWWIDHIDTALMGLVLYDATINKMLYRYNDMNIVALCLFVFILLLQMIYWSGDLSDTTYITLFKSTLISGMVVIGFLTIEKIFK